MLHHLQLVVIFLVMVLLEKILLFLMVGVILTSCESVYKPRFYDQRTFLLNGVSEEKSYGFSQNNPIKTGGGPTSELMYLNALTGPNGEHVDFYRIGSCCPYSDPDLYHGVYI